MECLSFCIANTLDLTRLDTYFKSTCSEDHITKYRDVLRLIPYENRHRLLFIFQNGTVVSWGFKRYQIKRYLTIIKQFADKLVNFFVHDEFSYHIGNKIAIQPHNYFDVDTVTIDEDNEELKLGLSYGFSQSVKLQYFETVIEALIEKYTPLIRRLSSKGQMPVTRKGIRQIIGEILDAKSEMNLISNFLYHPKYFWQHPTLEEYFTMLERYLHMERRIKAINHRLDTLNEIFAMFNSYLEDRHSHSLEMIIIFLIMIEIILAALNIHI